MFEHSVKDEQEFAHAGSQRHLGRFARRAQPLMKVPQRRVMADGGEGGHIERHAHLAAPAPDHSFAPQGAAVVVERRHADQLGDGAPTQAAEFRLRKLGFDLSDSVRRLCNSFAEKTHFWQTRHKYFPGLAWWRSQALKPRQRHAAGVGLDGDAQRQASIFRP
jgi:hypothetical protein